MMVLSYLIGQHYFPVKYNLLKFFGYLGFALFLYTINVYVKMDAGIIRIGFHTCLLAVFASVVYLLEKPGLSASR